MAAPNTERLAQIVELLSRVSTLIDGGYQYSSPLVRQNYQGKYCGPLVQHNGVIETLNAIATDASNLGAELQAAKILADDLGVDTVAMCGADLPVLARAFDGLCLDIVAACVRAADTISPAKPAERPRRPRKTAGSNGGNDGQSGLFNASDDAVPTTEDQS